MSELLKQKESLEISRNIILNDVLKYTPEKKEMYLVMFNDILIDINKVIKKGS